MDHNLEIKVHPRKIYLQNIFKGVQFLGAVVKPHRIYVAKRCLSNFKNELANKKEYENQNSSKIRPMINSYLGILSHYKTYNIRKKILNKPKHVWLFDYGWITVNYNKFNSDDSLETNSECFY